MGLPDSEGRDGQFEPIGLDACDSSDCLGRASFSRLSVAAGTLWRDGLGFFFSR